MELSESEVLDFVILDALSYLASVEGKAARDWYEKEAAEQTWSVRTLQHNISSQYSTLYTGHHKSALSWGRNIFIHGAF